MDWVALLIPIAGIVGGTIMLAILVAPIMLWMRYRHQLAKEKVHAEVTNPDNEKKFGRLTERLENLEALIVRLDTEINTQFERSLSMGRITTGANPAGVSQMPTTFMNVVSALEGRYQVLKELGRGGMGIVFQAYDKQLQEQVAIKILSPLLANDTDALERLKREVSAARRITHPNVIRIHDIAEVNGLQYVSMEYFGGINLRDHLKQSGHLSVMQAFNIASQICDGVQAAHAQGVIHRDLKSQNIILNAANQIKIIDFGLAHTQQQQGLTATGLIMGTPEYMSPEQVSGKRVDERTDIYSLGIILYEIFTGKVPFTGSSAISVGFQQMKDPPPLPSSINPQIGGPIEQVILKALQKDPMHRYRDVNELKQDLEAAINRPVVPELQQNPPVASIPVRSRE